MVDVITRLYAEFAQSKNAQARMVFLLFLVSIDTLKVGKRFKSQESLLSGKHIKEKNRGK